MIQAMSSALLVFIPAWICVRLLRMSLQQISSVIGPAPQAYASEAPIRPAASGNEAPIQPNEVFSDWIEGRQKPGGKVQAEAAYSDFAEMCNMHGVELMSQKAFFDALTRIVENSGGRFKKTKSNGRIVYHGWEIPGHNAPEYADYEQHAP